MRILGNGVDIIENRRIKKAIKNKKFIDKIFANKEKKFAKQKNANKTNYFAKRFVAKEAFLKALGTGLSNGFSFKDITVLNDKKGKPYIELKKKLICLLKKNLKLKITKSIYQYLMK